MHDSKGQLRREPMVVLDEPGSTFSLEHFSIPPQYKVCCLWL
jgi:hypothetical protein